MLGMLFLLIPFSIGQGAYSANHEFYSAIIEVDYSEERGDLRLSFRFFTDDLTLALERELGYKMSWDDVPNEADELHVAKYLNEHFKLSLDGQPLGWQWLGMEYEDESLWAYAELQGKHDVEELRLKCTLLLRYFPAQQNMVRIKWKQKNASWNFNQDYFEENLILKD
jgi:hypothetical protein